MSLDSIFLLNFSGPIDKKSAQNTIRCFVPRRKNWYFAVNVNEAETTRN